MVGWGKGPKTPALCGATLQSCLCPLLCKHLSNVLFSIVAWRMTVAKTDLFLKQKKTIFFLKKVFLCIFLPIWKCSSINLQKRECVKKPCQLSEIFSSIETDVIWHDKVMNTFGCCAIGISSSITKDTLYAPVCPTSVLNIWFFVKYIYSAFWDDSCLLHFHISSRTFFLLKISIFAAFNSQ